MATSGRGRVTRRTAGQAGFTLVELLITITVIGILAAIAVPAFTHQRYKAQDASAKSMARAGATALQSFAVENDNYAATRAQVLDLAPELDTASSWSLSTSPSAYRLSVTSSANHIYTIERSVGAGAVRSCSTGADPPGSGGCPSSGIW